jgi:acyl-CoA hydrolase
MSMVVGVRIESENIQIGEINHCNSSYFTMVAKNKKGKNVKVHGIILDTEQKVRRFARSIARQEQSTQKSNKFKASKFKIDEYLEV